jgi:hypothetical protein
MFVIEQRGVRKIIISIGMTGFGSKNAKLKNNIVKIKNIKHRSKIVN